MQFLSLKLFLVLFLITHVFCELESEIESPFPIRHSVLNEEEQEMYNNLYSV